MQKKLRGKRKPLKALIVLVGMVTKMRMREMEVIKKWLGIACEILFAGWEVIFKFVIGVSF